MAMLNNQRVMQFSRIYSRSTSMNVPSWFVPPQTNAYKCYTLYKVDLFKAVPQIGYTHTF